MGGREHLCGHFLVGHSPLLFPTTHQVWADEQAVADALDAGEAGRQLVEGQRRQLGVAAEAARGRGSLRVACIQWPQPLMACGAWVPQLVQASAGGGCRRGRRDEAVLPRAAAATSQHRSPWPLPGPFRPHASSTPSDPPPLPPHWCLPTDDWQPGCVRRGGPRRGADPRAAGGGPAGRGRVCALRPHAGTGGLAGQEARWTAIWPCRESLKVTLIQTRARGGPSGCTMCV